MSNGKNLNLEEGTINFWIPRKLFNYNDRKSHILLTKSNNQGSILILKDTDDKLKFFHVLIGKGRTDVEIDVSNLSGEDRHMVTATWSLASKQINLYVDGDKKTAKQELSF